MKARPAKFTPRRRGRRHEHSETTHQMHLAFLLRALNGRMYGKYTDGGPCDLNRQPKRAAAKAQRQARKAQRK